MSKCLSSVALHVPWVAPHGHPESASKSIMTAYATVCKRCLSERQMSHWTGWMTERMPLDLLGLGTHWEALCLDAVCLKLCTWVQDEHPDSSMI